MAWAKHEHLTAMGSLFEAAAAAFNLVLIFLVGWLIVVAATVYTERRLRRGKTGTGPGIVGSITWLWDNANVIGIPTLVLGATYLVWAMYFGPGLSAGPTMLVVMLMAAAGLLIGFAPSARRGGRAPR